MYQGIGSDRKLQSVLSICLVLTSLMARAAVEVAPVHAEGYGYAQTPGFQQAIVGRVPMTLNEQAQIAALLPARTDQRLYLRFRMNQAQLIFDGLKNDSLNTNKSGVLTKKRATATKIGSEVALGYSWSNFFRADLEYLSNKDFQYSVDPVFVGNTGTTVAALKSTIKNNAVLANFYYDYYNNTAFTPYLAGSLGLSTSKLSSSLTPPSIDSVTGSSRASKIAYGLGAGLKMRVVGNAFLDCSYRYLHLASKLQMRPGSGIVVNGNYSASMLSLGLIYVF